jgi:hypothetical protein
VSYHNEPWRIGSFDLPNYSYNPDSRIRPCNAQIFDVWNNLPRVAVPAFYHFTLALKYFL